MSHGLSSICISANIKSAGFLFPSGRGIQAAMPSSQSLSSAQEFPVEVLDPIPHTVYVAVRQSVRY